MPIISLERVLRVIFPEQCLGCGRGQEFFCRQCRREAEALAAQLCPVCELPARLGQTHPRCRRAQGLDGLLSAFVYKGGVRRAIMKLKFRPYLFAGTKALVEAALEREEVGNSFSLLREFLGRPVFVPVPLHFWKQKTRGYNQAELLARALEKKLDIPVVADLLVRTKMTAPQKGLKAPERQKNLQGAFKINLSGLNGGQLFNTVILVDDIWTTGATLKSCCQVLKRAGIEKVYAVTLAR